MRPAINATKAIMIKTFPYRFEMILTFQQYLNSNEWKNLREAVKKRDKETCIDCNKFIGNNGTCHHEHYRDWGKGNSEELRSCIYLCKECNEERHHDPKMREIVPFWAKRHHNTGGYDDIDSVIISDPVKMRLRRYDEILGLLIDFLNIDLSKIKDEILQGFIRKVKKIFWKHSKEVLREADL